MIGGRAVIIRAIAVVGVAWWSAPQGEKARVVSAPSVDESASQVTSEGGARRRLLSGGAAPAVVSPLRLMAGDSEN